MRVPEEFYRLYLFGRVLMAVDKSLWLVFVFAFFPKHSYNNCMLFSSIEMALLRSLLSVLIFLLLVLLFLFLGSAFAQQTACTNLFSSGSKMPAGFGASYDLFGPAKALLLSGSCSGETVNVTYGSNADNQYIYNQGYYWNGTRWTLLALSGADSAGTWLVRSGTGSFPKRHLDPAISVGYVCQYVDNAWKCGCSDTACTTPGWQVQGVQGASTEPADPGGGAVTPGQCVVPPTLNSPLIYQNKCPEDSGGPANVNAAERDVLIELPRNRTCTKGLVVSGAYPTQNGGNVIIRGGKIKPLSGTNIQLITIRAIMPGKTVHIEGVSLDSNNLIADNIREYANDGVNIVVQNSHMGYQSTSSSFHGDCMQTQGVGHPASIKLQNLTCVTAGNGLQIPYSSDPSYGGGNIGATYYLLDRVNIRRYNNRGGGNNINIGDVPGSPLWNAGYKSAIPPGGIDFKDVWVNWTGTMSIFKDAVSPRPTRIGLTNCGNWPNISNVKDKMCEGDPPDGDFAPADKVGLSYNRSDFCR